MPSVPPYSRREKIEHYANKCAPVKWTRDTITSLDGTKLSLCIGQEPTRSAVKSKQVVLLYFQGNASSLPPRLPALSAVLKSLPSNKQDLPAYTIIALSYRGFWTSAGRASQSGIEQDAAAAINYARDYCAGEAGGAKLVLWGQSIGAGVASTALANVLSGKFDQPDRQKPNIVALILETPFTSVKKMLATLYPERWLPYRYLFPFLRSWWDSEAALKEVAKHSKVLPILFLVAQKDEVVTAEHGDELINLCKKLQLEIECCRIPDALHTEAMSKDKGRVGVRDFVRRLTV